MALKTNQQLATRLAMTPQLQQSLKLLAMNVLELEQYLEELLQSNPLLELEEAPQPSLEREEPALSDSGDLRWDMLARAFDEEEAPREANWRAETTPLDRLREQIDREPLDATTRAIAHAIVDALDEDGYFRESPEVIAKALQVTPQQVERVLVEVVQRCDPPGIGARDLTECFLLQLAGSDAAERLARRILLHARELLVRGEDEAICELLGCTPRQLAAAKARMRRLDPWPGHGLRGTPALYLRPELEFRRAPDGSGFVVELLQPIARRLQIHNPWQGRCRTAQEKAFLREAMREAKGLMQALSQRERTLLSVGEVLARRQQAFLALGPLGLRPLTLADVAAETGLHESTISRATHGKYARTPLGVVELRRFFCTGLPTRGGGVISVERVQARIRALIEHENPARPISDQAIAERLQAEGIEIARRTVAKYREQMGIPSSSKRRIRKRKTKEGA